MSHFYGWLQGSRGNTHRAGSKSSGINATIQSWNNKVSATLKDDNGTDVLVLSIPDKLNKVFLNGDEIDIKSISKHWEKISKMIKETELLEEL